MLHILKFITLLLIQTHFLHVEADPRRTVAAVLEDANYLALARRRPKHEKTETISDVISAQSISSVPHVVSKTTTETGYHKKSKVWPPWPFNLLEKGAKTSQEGDSGIVAASNTYPSAASLFWEYFKQRTRIGVRQCREIGAEMFFHLPPALPPFIVLASLPRKVVADNLKDAKTVSRRIVPLVSLPFARSLACGGLFLTILSWADMEIHRKRTLTPLLPHRSVSKASVVLPPFLPEAEPEPELAAIESVEQAATGNEKKVVGVDGTRANLLSPKLRKHLADLYDIAPRPRNVQSFVADWKQARVVRKREAAKIRRQTIFDELVALQAIKRNSRRFQKQRGSGTVKEGGPEELGYALVTGASQGIGRAIAVELARWDIPLILVARDVDKLTSLAFDLEACYGVKCCVLQADLSKVDAAEKIHRTTSDNGIVVDILANNAGVTNAGLSVDTAVSDLENMVNVNALTYAKLSCLYGQDMKNRKRGRILMVSSMAGLASAAPNTAIYGATKAFGKSLALSMAKELEQYGIGVTCLIPGPVTTEFRHSSPGMARALCWYLPFYPKSAESVAHLGVMSLLDGDTQVIPGWQNRVFVKIMRPILPQRLEALCTEAAFSPLRLPHLYPFRRRQQDGQNETKKTNDAFESARGERSTGPILRPRHNMLPLPRLLKLQTADPEDRNEDPNEMKVAEHEDEDNDHDDKAPKETANLQLDGVTTESEDTNEISTSYNPNSEKEEPGEQSIDTEKEKPPKEYSGKVVGKFSLPDDCEVQNEISPLLGPIDLMETEKTQLL